MAIINGDSGDNELHGTENTDTIRGKGGNDWLLGHDGDDFLYGGGMEDALEGGAGNDSLFGDKHNDWLYGGLGDDLLQGGDGDDRLYGEEGQDVLRGGAGNDQLDGGDALDGPDEADVLWGEAGDDQFFGGENDTFRGGTGNDTYWGGLATIIEKAGEGKDTVVASEYDLANAPNVENLVTRVIGWGNEGDNVIRGRYDGQDGRSMTLYGRGGDDHLLGNNFAANTYFGGSGRDTFYRTPIWDGDAPFYERTIIMDFEGGRDRIASERLDVNRPTRWMEADEFHSGAGATAVAQNEDHRYIYDRDTGYLYRDGDGTGPSQQQVFMEIHVASGQLSHRDFYYMPPVPHFDLV
jgi:Ca2+-binding RTX toxin-like protein